MSISSVNNQLERSGVGLGIRKVSQWVAAADFTDGGSTAGTIILTDKIPAGSFVLGSKTKVMTGFLEDTSCVMDIGDGSDADLFSYTTINIFTAADNLLEGCDSAAAGNTGTGIVPILSETSITLTVTSAADFTSVFAGSGRMLVEVYYFSTNVEAQDNYPYRYKHSS